MDGFEATRRLQKNPDLRHIKVVLVSASTSSSPESILMKNDLNGFLAKPVQLSEVLDTLQVCLDLEWQYAPTAELSLDNAATSSSGEMLLPPLDDIAALHTFALSGDIMEIRQRLDTIEHADPRYAIFAGKVRQLAKVFEIREIQEIKEQYLNIPEL
jgi:hypothetical protein